MKLKVVIVCFFLFKSFFASGQFEWSNPRPTGYKNTKIVFTDAATGYLFNENGDLFRTTDTGKSWMFQQNFPRCVTMNVKDSVFLIAGADSVVYISKDNAHTWEKGRIGYPLFIKNIDVINKDTLFAGQSVLDGGSKLFQSVDGGKNWQLVNDSLAIKSFDFVNSKLGYAGSYTGVYKTTDGGRHWKNTLDSIKPNVNYVAFFDDNVGYGASGGGVYRTIDGGLKWNLVTGPSVGTVYSIAFANTQRVIIAGDAGAAVQTDDGGNKWTAMPIYSVGENYPLYTACYSDTQTIFLAGLKGRILRTNDAGQTWQKFSPTYVDIKPLSFPTDSTGYFATWFNLYKTNDAGKTWSVLPFSIIDQSKRFKCLHFFSRDTGVLIIESPVEIYKTFNGGQTWSPIQLSILYKDAISGYYFSKSFCYINVNGAYGNTILQSKDQGDNWRLMSTEWQGTYTNLFFVDEKSGYGSKGAYLYKTTDSAKSWTNILNVFPPIFTNIWFTDAATGYAITDGGNNLMTKDSGMTWNTMEIYHNNANFTTANVIRFFNKKIGYLASRYGEIYKSFNGGDSWMLEKTAPSESTSIAMTSNGFIYMAGNGGMILKKNMHEYWIDSISVRNQNCGFRFSADVTAALSIIDSVWIQYGTTGFPNQIKIAGVIKDSTLKADSLITGVINDSTYQARIKILYNGNYYYSDPVVFKATGLPQSVITFNGTLLSSSASTGNQWFLNGIAIPGATGSTYQPAIAGIYTVQQTISNCTSAMSAGFNYSITALNDPQLQTEINVVPNPVFTTLWIQNPKGKNLSIQILDINGRILKQISTTKILTGISNEALSAGVYFVKVRDVHTNKMILKKIIKLY